VAVGRHPTRNPLFSVEERVSLIEQAFGGRAHITISAFDGLLAEFARDIQAGVFVRGLRVCADFKYELQLAQANADLASELETIFLTTRANYGFISASLVREIARHGGDVSRYAPEPVCLALKKIYG